MNKLEILKRGAVVGIAMLMISGIIYAEAPFDDMQVAGNGGFLSITPSIAGGANPICQKITNNNSQAIFVPTKTQDDWSAFIANHPNYIDLDVCSVPLAYPSTHTDLDCVSPNVLMGTAPNQFCKFSAASCPNGWASYNNWSTTTPTTCYGEHKRLLAGLGARCEGATNCTTSSHAWSPNATREPCSYINETIKLSIVLIPYCDTEDAPTCIAAVTEVGCY